MDTAAVFLANVLKSKLIARAGEKLEGVPWPLLLPRGKDMKTFAPWEARAPDLEVNSLTLWPAELRKLDMHSAGLDDKPMMSTSLCGYMLLCMAVGPRRGLPTATHAGVKQPAKHRSLGGSSSRP